MQSRGHSAIEKRSEGPLDSRYEGPYTIIRRSGEKVKLSLPERDNWVHLNRCKPYEKSKLTTLASTPQDNVGNGTRNVVTEQEDPGLAPEEEPDLTPGQSVEPYRDLRPVVLGDEVIEPARRYLKRSHEPP